MSRAFMILTLMFTVAAFAARTTPVEANAQRHLRTQLDDTPIRPDPGDPIGTIRIPAIGVDKVIVSGIGVDELRTGPGHYPDTPAPGQPGNTAIAGHRTTYGAPFGDLDQLETGDVIHVTTSAGTYTYTVDGIVIIEPDDMTVLAQDSGRRLTLTACHPKGSRSHRIVVQATHQQRKQI